MTERLKSPTLEDVARLAEVSTATISRAINDPDKVAKPTRDRIETAITALGYTPHFGASALASHRTRTVGAIIPTMANAMFASGLQAFEEALSEAGVTLLVATTGYDPEQELRQIRTLMARGADGLLLIGTARPQATRDFLAQRQVPHVIGWAVSAAPDQVCAGFDNAVAGSAMAQAVLDAGHRRIAAITGHLAGNDRASDRLSGIRDTIAAAGAILTGVREAMFRIEHGGDAFAALMAVSKPPTAVICGNDVFAAGAVVRAAAMGLAVPDDVSITGFDDIGLALVTSPPLTTMRVPQIEMGQAAARLLLARLAGAVDQASVTLPVTLVRRGSLGPPRS